MHDLTTSSGVDVAFGRMRRDGNMMVTTPETHMALGDLVSLVGPVEDLDRVTAYLGEPAEERLELDRSEYDYRRVFVSNPTVAGHRISDLVPQQFGAVVTRVRRGDVEMLAHEDTVIELGDRLRVVAHRADMEAVSRFFGDSYRALSEIDILTFFLGLAIGLLVGMIPIPLPGGVVLELGIAGGPLVVALKPAALGFALEQTGNELPNIG